jgi:cytochrome b pre-mRNA-processing protein 3
MLKILSRITGSHRPEIKDAKRIYKKIMIQSRIPDFYGDDLCADTTDGRMEILCLHLSTVMHALRIHGETGAKLNQAIYDVMIDDFDVALREEGLSDTGVARRIKPLAKMFFTRAKQYADAFEVVGSDKDTLTTLISNNVCKAEDNTGMFVKYATNFLSELNTLSLGQIALADIGFPKFH